MKKLLEERVGVGAAKSHFSELLDRVQDESLIVTVTRHGRPIARIVPVDFVPDAGHLADARGWLDDDDSFFVGLEEIVASRARHRPRRLMLE